MMWNYPANTTEVIGDCQYSETELKDAGEQLMDQMMGEEGHTAMEDRMGEELSDLMDIRMGKLALGCATDQDWNYVPMMGAWGTGVGINGTGSSALNSGVLVMLGVLILIGAANLMIGLYNSAKISQIK